MIRFDAEGVELPDLDFRKVREWIALVVEKHGYTVGRLSYCFCDDETILEANRRHLGHDYYTDIITFDYTHGSRIGGDMIISLDTVRSNSGELGLPYESELLRVVIHGVLHLVGISDKGPGEREIMEANENEALAMYKAIAMSD